MASRPLLFSFLISFLFLTVGCPRKPALEALPAEVVAWPPAPQTARITFVEAINDSRWAEPPTKWQRFLNKLAGGEQFIGFKKPFAVTTDPRGRVLVSDPAHGKVLVFDREDESFTFLGDKGARTLFRPAGLVTDSRGHVFVADSLQGLVFEYDSEHEFVRTYGDELLVRPSGVAVDEGARRLWVVDSKRHCLDLFELGGRHLRTVGERGNGEGQFNFPGHIAISGDEVYIADTLNFRLQVFDDEGRFVHTWGENCDHSGCLHRAKGVGVDPDGHVYVVDAAFQNVQIFDPEGQLLLFFGGGGQGPGQLQLPAGMHITDDGLIYVVSQYGWRVNIYQYHRDPASPDTQ